MSTYTNSETTTYNEDGSVTTSLTYTELPATKKEKAFAWTIFSGIILVSCAPLLVIAADEYHDRKERRKLKKEADAQKNEN